MMQDNDIVTIEPG